MKYDELKDYLTRYLKARIPLIIIDTVEKNRALRLIKEVQNDINYEFKLFKLSEGIINLRDNAQITDENTIAGALDYIAVDIKTKDNNNYILGDISDVSDSNMLSRYLCEVVERCEQTSSTIIIITNDILWDNLLRLGISLPLEYPSQEEIYQIISKYIANYKSQIQIEWDEKDTQIASNYLQGLSEIEVKNIIASYIAKGIITKEDLNELKDIKKILFTDIAGLEYIDVPENMHIAGLDNLKDWIFEKKEVLDPQRSEELKARGIKQPRGVLLTGVPGCGKSYSSKAIASIFNYPLYRLDLATVQGEYVGQSERQLKAALDKAEYMSPCVLWIDEIEKGLKDSSSSSVTSKMIGQFLFWLQEFEKPVFVVASANSIEDLPPELTRKGRFDEIFFVDLPNKNERKELLDIYSKKYLRIELGPNLIDKLVTITEGFSSSDIEATLRDIAYTIIANPSLKISEEYLLNTLSNVVSISKNYPEKINKIREWGKNKAIKASRE